MGAEQVAICCIDSPWPAQSKLGFGMGGRGKAQIFLHTEPIGYLIPSLDFCFLGTVGLLGQVGADSTNKASEESLVYCSKVGI